MKKLAKLKLQNLSVLDAKKMQALRGGCWEKFCILRCAPMYQDGISVDNCSQETLDTYHCDPKASDEPISCIC